MREHRSSRIDKAPQAQPAEQERSLEHEIHARTRWWHEEALINQRITWFLGAEVILGGGYAWIRYRIAEICFGDGTAKAVATYIGQLSQLSAILLWIGIAVAAFALVGVAAAWMAQRILQERRYPQFQLGVSAGTTWFGLAAATALPLACAVAWTASAWHLGDPTKLACWDARPTTELTH